MEPSLGDGGKPMRKIALIIILSLTLPAIQVTYLGAEIKDIPSWVDELQLNVGRSLHTKVEISRINELDYIERREYPVIRLQGEGSLKKVSDPFEVMHKLFLSNDWKEDWKYTADGHGSSSFAYRKETHFCIVLVQIDSSCDDEETGHVPSVFWFSIDCRESNIIQR
jgi:hypothetical protein